MKYLFLIGDGMGDWPHPALDHQTPLEAAETPHMDAIAAQGIIGTCRTIPEGMEPGSDVANMALLGFDPQKFHTGRGPIEAAAQGLELGSKDLIWRCNLVSLSEFSDQGIMQDYSAGHIETSASRPLIQDLQNKFGGEKFDFHTGVQYRHLLVQKDGASTSAAKLQIRPPHDILDQSIMQDWDAFCHFPDLFALMQGAAQYLVQPKNTSKANSIWPWGQGSPLMLPDFKQIFGLRGAVVSAVDLVRGLGKAAGMDVLEVEGVTGLIDTNYDGKVQAALDFLQTGDFVYLHVEAPDECGHMGKPDLKKKAVELFDSRVVGPIRQAMGEDAMIMVTCDHFTPLQERTHTLDPVPFAFCGPKVAPSGCSGFTEKTAQASPWRLSSGPELLPFILKAAQGE